MVDRGTGNGGGGMGNDLPHAKYAKSAKFFLGMRLRRINRPKVALITTKIFTFF